jgi:hypothetical protein
MKTRYGRLAVAFGALVVALSFVPNCAAQCLGAFHPRLSHSNWHSQPGRVQLLPAAFVAKDNGDNDDATIVGFWHQKLVIPGNNGANDTLFDEGLSQWHSDGTELLNSLRPPTVARAALGQSRSAGALHRRPALWIASRH